MGCYSCMKFLFVFLNIIFLIFGITGVGLIVWILLDRTIPLHFAQEQGDFTIAAVIYLIVAIMLILLSILGIYSVTKEVRWAVVVSFSLLLIVIVVEVASGIWIWVNREPLSEFTRTNVKDTVQESYDKNKSIKEIFDTIQSKMQCCGADSPIDWSRNKDINLGVVSKPTKYTIPLSCCRESIVESQCLKATTDIKMGEKPDFNIIYDKGCYILIKEKVMSSLPIILAVFGSIVGIKILGLLIGLILAFSMNRSDRYKA
ncbi:CD82 antigen-like [Euwallacea similis]|uniref:CD82 antigen-like n=1 Tax=Euwallacea similis TaxID=1736056 RepID=UPI00344D7AE7